MYKRFLKRFLDLVISLLGFLALLPITIPIVLILLPLTKGNPLFFQLRPGRQERIFKIYKFKTMSELRDGNGALLPDEARITPFGTFLRKTSLDEIPQLLNIIKGDMSLVGPRPLLVRYLPYYTPKERLRHTVRPGITGLAQISGRNLLHWDTRLQKDVEYVENISFALDCHILFRTLLKVVTAKDVALTAESGMIDLDKLRRTAMDLDK